jgi:hypothetical protein
MLVIEGFAGKSVEVSNYLRSLNGEKALIVDTKGLPKESVRTGNKKVDANVFFLEVRMNTSLEELFNTVENIVDASFKGVEHLIFYTNAYEHELAKFKELETKTGLKLVTCVQPPVGSRYSANTYEL